MKKVCKNVCIVFLPQINNEMILEIFFHPAKILKLGLTWFYLKTSPLKE